MKTRIAALTAAMVLGSCSYAYDIQAVMIDGRLGFAVDGSPECFSSISVTDSSVELTQSSGRDAPWVWHERFGDCANPFPVIYGQTLKGAPPVSGDPNARIAAKPLIVGVTYDVNTSSKDGGYGAGRFRLTAEGGVENVRRTPR